MRLIPRWLAIVVGSLLVVLLHGSRVLADGSAGTLKFLVAGPTTPAADPTSEVTISPPPLMPEPAQPAAPEVTISAPPESAKPAEPEAQPLAVPQPSPHTSPAPAFPRPGVATTAVRQPLAEPLVTNQTRQALNFYGGYSARATLSQLPRRAALQPSGSQPIVRQSKPFQAIHHEPTVSPYLNLHRDDVSAESAPNYFAFVRPQMEQLDAARAQQREIQRLQRQLQSMPSTMAGPRYQSAGGPGAGSAARFMDTAQFYAGRR